MDNQAVRRSGGQWCATLVAALSLTVVPTYRLTAQDTASVTGTSGAAATEPTISLSQNPLLTGTVVMLWTAAGSGPAQVFVYSALGTPVAGTTMLPDPGRWEWDGRTGGVDVANGAYFVVVIRGDGRRLRRRLIVAH